MSGNLYFCPCCQQQVRQLWHLTEYPQGICQPCCDELIRKLIAERISMLEATGVSQATVRTSDAAAT